MTGAEGPGTMRPRSGRSLQAIGVGTWTFGGTPGGPQAEREADAIRQAIALGQNHIDTAEDYADGGAEEVVGQAIAGLRREDLFIASKLWKNHVAVGTVGPAVEAMLRRLRTDYLDLLYIHHPWPKAPWRDALPQIDRLIDEGIVRHLGVSNFNVEQLREAAARSRHPIAANQVRYSCDWQLAASTALVNWCRAHDVAIVAYRPLNDARLIDNPVLAAIGSRQHATPAQVALAWLVTKRALPIPKALAADHVRQNAAAARVRLSMGDIALIERSFRLPPVEKHREEGRI